MKKLITTNTGGLPVTLDLFKFMDAKSNDIAALLASLGTCIISGCALTPGGSNWQCAPGYVMLVGEIYAVDGGDTGVANAANPESACFWNVLQTVVNPSTEVYHDLNSHDDTLERKAVLNAASSFINYASSPKFEELIAMRIGALDVPWIAPVLGAGVANVGSVNPAGYCIDYFKNVRLKGLITVTVASGIVNNLLLFTLPITHWPAFPYKFPVYFKLPNTVNYADVLGTEPWTVQVNTDGTVVLLLAEAVTSPFTMDLSCISFRTA